MRPVRRCRPAAAAERLRCLPTEYAACKRNMPIRMPPYRINHAVYQKRTAKSTDRERDMPFVRSMLFWLEYYFISFMRILVSEEVRRELFR